MRNFLKTKNSVLLLLLMFVLPTFLQIQQVVSKPLGRFWEYIYDPSNPAFTQQKNEVVNFMKDYFDEKNIPLISIAKLSPDGGKLYGMDSIYKHSQEYSIMRWKTWYKFYRERDSVLPYPWFNYRGYYFIDENDAALGTFTPHGTAWNRVALEAIKYIWDSVETKGSPTNAVAVMPITVTSEIKDGYITGKMSFTNANPEILAQDNGGLSFLYNIILAEGYHKYGTEEHYFIPRYELGSSLETTSNDFIDSTKEVTFRFPIDKSWNTKYLYVIGVIEGYPQYPAVNYVSRFLFDVAVDRVPDIKTAAQHTQLKLNVTHNQDAQKCSKIATNASTDIVFKVENTSSSAVTAAVYIDENTSNIGPWIVTPNVTTINIPPSSSTNVIVKVQAPYNESAVAFDLAVLPINTATDVNPVISNALTVVTTNNVNILGMAPKSMNGDYLYTVQLPFYSNSYYSRYGTVPLEYYPVINLDQFSGFVVSYGSPYKLAKYQLLGNQVLDGQPTPETSHTIYSSINANLNANLQDELAVNNVLTAPQTKFLNDIVAGGKHLALFVDRTAAYSTLTSTPAADKAELQKLFANFGVSFKDETYRLANNNDGTALPTAFNITGVNGDALSNGLDIQLNDVTRTVAYTTNWSLTGQTTKVFSYKDINNSTAAAKATRGASKLFLAGFGLEGVFENTLENSNQFGKLFDNITVWWFGPAPVAKPTISVENTTIDFGQQPIGSSNIVNVVISNTATNANDVLIISPGSRFINNTDNSFSVLKLPGNIGPGQKDTLILQFAPKTAKKYEEVYTLISNDPNNGEISLTCQGEGIVPANPPTIKIDITEHDFGEFTVNPDGDVSAYKDFIVTNLGDSPLIISSVNLSAETDATVYSLTNNIGKTLNKYEELTFRSRFTALKTGVFNGAIEVHSNDAQTAVAEIELTATVVEDIYEQIAAMFNCRVAPVPATEVLNIDFNVIGELARNVKMNIVDQTGKTVFSNIIDNMYTPGNHKKSINVGALPIGSYFLEYIINDMRASVPFNIAR